MRCAVEFDKLNEDEQDELAVNALAGLREAGFDLALLLKVVLRRRPHIKGKRLPQTLIYARTAVVRSVDLYDIIDGLAWHTRKLDISADAWAVRRVKQIVVEDVERLAPHLRTNGDKYDKNEMLSFSISRTVRTMREHAPVLWDIAETVAVSPRQATENTYKKSDPVSTSLPANPLLI